MDIVTKKQLNILIQLAEADKEFAPEEKELILQIAHRKNFPESEVERLIDRPEPIGTLGALSADQKFDYLISSIELIFADRKIHDSELIFGKGIAIKLGFKKTVIDFLKDNYGKMSLDELRTTTFHDYL